MYLSALIFPSQITSSEHPAVQMAGPFNFDKCPLFRCTPVCCQPHLYVCSRFHRQFTYATCFWSIEAKIDAIASVFRSLFCSPLVGIEASNSKLSQLKFLGRLQVVQGPFPSVELTDNSVTYSVHRLRPVD